MTRVREILISVAGLTPQIITESLYCLTQIRKPPARISEIWVITTVAGRRKVEDELLLPRKGWFFRFCDDYGLDAGKIRFGPDQIVVISDKDGRALEDVRTLEDNAAVADFITSFVRHKASDLNVRLHCSVAGGRKTMGLYLGLALQLYGRLGDTLSHVLVRPPELEGDPGFYYPPKKLGLLRIKGRRIAGNDVRVELAETPVLMLRGKLPALEANEGSYSALIRKAQEDYSLLKAPPRVVVDTATGCLSVGDQRVRLSPLEMAIYLIFGYARRNSCGRAACDGCNQCTFAASDFLGEEGVKRLREALLGLKTKDVRLKELRGWEAGDPTNAEKRFREVRSRVNRKIQEGLGGEAWPDQYTIAALRLPAADRVRYGIRLNPRLLTIR